MNILLDACAALTAALLGACPTVTLLATSREPIRAAGEITWQVPSLSLDDEAVELFIDRARQITAGLRDHRRQCGDSRRDLPCASTACRSRSNSPQRVSAPCR